MKSQSRVLVVDDLPHWRQTLAGLLRDEGFVVVTAPNQQEALTQLSQQRFAVAVLDVRLDETDENNREGLQLMYEIRERYPQTAIIILTGYADVEMVRAALEPDIERNAPAFGFLEKKEADIKQLVDYVKQAIAHRQPPKFKPSQECKLNITLEPGQKPQVQSHGKMQLVDHSKNVLELEVERFKRLSEIGEGPDKRFNLGDTGQRLYQELLKNHPVLAESYSRALGCVTKRQYLHLAFETSSDLVSLPLEFLYSPKDQEYLTLLHPLTRKIRGVVTSLATISPEMVKDLIATGEALHLLILVSNTSPAINLIDEMGEQLTQLLETVEWVKVTRIKTEEATHSRVQNLLNGCKYHIVHYIGHGHYREDSSEQSSLYFWEKENRSGSVMPMTASQLRLLLQDSNVRLFHLTCCEGSKTAGSAALLENDYLSISDGIMQAGVPAVLGYRWPVPANRANDLALTFYRSLIQCGSPPLALLEARRELAMKDKNEPTWVSPILICQE